MPRRDPGSGGDEHIRPTLGPVGSARTGSVSLAGRRVLVTGGSLGIGLEVSRELARRGARVIVAARGLEAIDAAVGGLDGQGHEACALDVSDRRRGRRRCCDRRRRTTARAGHGGGRPRSDRPLEELDPGAFIEAIEINLIGTMLALSHALPRLRSAAGRAVTLSRGRGDRHRCHATTPTRPRRQRSSD